MRSDKNKKSHNENEDVNKKRIKILDIIMGFTYIIVLLGITTPLVLFYGPYDDTRKTFIGTLLGTRHAYLLTDHMSQDTINELMGVQETFAETTQEEPEEEQNIDAIEVEQTSGTEIERYNIKTNKYDAYILEIKNPCSVKVAMTKYLGKYGETTSEMAEDNNAIAAINGGSFIDKSADGVEYAGTGALPGGFVISDGKVIYPKENVDKDDIENVIAFTKSGTLVVGDHSINELEKLDVKEAMTFRRPNVLINGERQDNKGYDIGLNPRTVVGQKRDGTVIFLVIDGRKITKPGANLKDIQDILLQREVYNAGCLDGGYSTTMYYKGEVINSPNSWNGERAVATAFYVK